MDYKIDFGLNRLNGTESGPGHTRYRILVPNGDVLNIEAGSEPSYFTTHPRTASCMQFVNFLHDNNALISEAVVVSGPKPTAAEAFIDCVGASNWARIRKSRSYYSMRCKRVAASVGIL